MQTLNLDIIKFREEIILGIHTGGFHRRKSFGPQGLPSFEINSKSCKFASSCTTADDHKSANTQQIKSEGSAIAIGNIRGRGHFMQKTD